MKHLSYLSFWYHQNNIFHGMIYMTMLISYMLLFVSFLSWQLWSLWVHCSVCWTYYLNFHMQVDTIMLEANCSTSWQILLPKREQGRLPVVYTIIIVCGIIFLKYVLLSFVHINRSNCCCCCPSNLFPSLWHFNKCQN